MMAQSDNNFLAHAIEADRLLQEFMRDRPPAEHLDELKVMVEATLKEAQEDAKDPKWKEGLIGGDLDKDDEEKEPEGEEEKTENA